MNRSTSIDIERAIETVRLFSQPLEHQSLPSLEEFVLKDGRLQHQPRSMLKQTLAFTKDCLACTFSSVMREKQAEKQKAINATLQQSLDLLKVYSSALGHMQKGSVDDKLLARRVVMAANTYNALVRQAKLHPHSLSKMLKLFLLKMAGWAVDDELVQNEIHIPQTLEISGHKISYAQKSETAKKVLSLLQSAKRYVESELLVPKSEELDLFRVKTITLLQTQKSLPYSLEEILSLVQTAPIEYALLEGAHLFNGSVIELKTMLCNFPGVETEVKGAFQRDNFHPELVLPIKESFQVASYSSQTGFPHPSQYIGMALHEKLVPTFLLRPKHCPQLENLLEIKRHIAQELNPNGLYYNKAKELLQKRSALFQNHKALFKLHQEAINALFGSNFLSKLSYQEQSKSCARFMERVSAQPIRTLQEEWLLKNSKEIHLSPKETAQRIMLAEVEKAKTELEPLFTPTSIETIGGACINIHLMQISEHLHFEPPKLSAYEQKLLISLLRQQLLFAYELLELKPEALLDHLIKITIEEIALFTKEEARDEYSQQAQDIVQELIHYYTLRFEAHFG